MKSPKMTGASLENTMPKDPDQDEMDTAGHLDTLNRAADILNNPAKLKRVHKLAGRRHKAVMGMTPPAKVETPKIKSLDDLKKKAYAKADTDDEV